MLTRKKSERSKDSDVISDFDSFRFQRILGDGARACARVRMRGEEGGEGRGWSRGLMISSVLVIIL